MNHHLIEKILKCLDSAGLLVDRERAKNALAVAFMNEIHIVWTIDDVQTIAKHLSDEQARDVLEKVEHYHDAEIGVNWDVLREWAPRLEDDEEEEEDQEDDLLLF